MSRGRRLLSAPGLVLGMWLGILTLAAVAGFLIRAATQSSMGPFAGPAPGTESVLSLAQLLYYDRALAATSVLAPAIAATVGALGWTLGCGIAIARLSGETHLGTLGHRWLATLPGVLVQSGWHLVMRACGVVLLGIAVAPLPDALGIALMVGGWWIASLALDVTRVGVVLHEASPWSPLCAGFAFVRAVSRPRLVLATGGLNALQAAAGLAIAWLGLHAIGPASVTLAMAATALLAVVLGLWRLAIVIDHGPIVLRRRAGS